MFFDEIDPDDYFHEDVRKLVQHYISLFFLDKVHPLDLERIRNNEDYISLIWNCDLCTGIDAVYDLIEKNKDKFPEIDDKPISEIKYALSILERCAKIGIPKVFAIGIILLFLKICKGCETAF